ncbi:universal stress protein [Streptacidiphilus sp. PB12-B1b]|uniref:universal stress protein n=1 Tax=Streptacidiphilus sp. PB12-B1b TaxID=2705012 RepID=UPI0015F8CC2D|nr:universal stress protein [Streptacidiphilus sp. PB12-B1b]QMU74655.1 universal stress protein [Streptacidiphilus sp. PB12-B1b]
MPNPVVVGVDDVAGSGAAVDWAADEARLRGARLLLVHARLWEPHRTPEHAPQGAGVGEQAVAELVERAVRRHPGLPVDSVGLDQVPRDALVALSAEGQLVVVGSRGTGGFPDLLTGSTALHVAADAVCPAVVVPGTVAYAPGTGGATGSVAVGVHGREAEEELLRFAFEAAQRRQSPLRVVHAWSYPLVGHGRAVPPVYEEGHIAAEEERLVAEVLAGWRQRYPEVAVEQDVVRSGPAKRLVALSTTSQLIVVGRRGNPDGPLGRLGSVSQAVVHHARCPVAVVPLP